MGAEMRIKNKFNIECPNGWHISVTWNPGSYSGNRYLDSCGQVITIDSHGLFEAAVFNQNGKIVVKDCDPYHYVRMDWITGTLLPVVMKLENWSDEDDLPDNPVATSRKIFSLRSFADSVNVTITDNDGRNASTYSGHLIGDDGYLVGDNGHFETRLLSGQREKHDDDLVSKAMRLILK